MEPIEVVLTFRGGFAVGSGFGLAGALDHLIERDVDGLPTLPGTSLKGILREACEDIALLMGAPPMENVVSELADLLHRGIPPDHENFGDVHRIFGSSFVDPLFRFESAYLDVSDRRLADLVSLHATWAESHNRIHRETGTAEEDHLYSQEFAVTDLGFLSLPFRFRIHPLREDIPDRLLGILICGLRFAERLGAKKSRGKGIVDMNLARPYRGKTMERWVACTLLEGSG